MTPTASHSSIALCTATLPDVLASGVAVPTYDRSGLVPRIVHLGVGGFHRAHLALYCDQLAAAGSDWGICGIGMLASDAAMAKIMAEQDHLYTLSSKGNGEPQSQIIGSIIDYHHLAGDLEAFIAIIARPETAIVSMTITEAGYAEPKSGSNSTFDWLVAGLDARRVAGLPPVTILSCDNLPGNGDVAAAATMRAAGRRSEALASWIQESCTFPNSMVDRITPVTTDTDRSYLLERYGLVDQWPVVAEPFIQWVIEDRFAAGRPAFEDAGVLISSDVHAWELYKLRMLNAGHSTLAYLSSLAGLVFVDEVMSNDVMSTYVRRFLCDEAVPTLTQIEGFPREGYVASVVERFANTGVRDQIARLCIDGSAKYPIFLIPTIERQLELDGPITLATLALAGWARYLVAKPAGELAADASLGQAVTWANAATTDPAAFLRFDAVFPSALASNERFRAQFVSAYESLASGDIIGAVAEALANGGD